MRILRVITRLDGRGGAEASTILEVEEHASRGHEVMVVTLVEPPTPDVSGRLEASGVEWVHLDGRMLGQVRALRGLVRRWKPTVVHAVILRAEVVVVAGLVGLSVPLVISLVNMQYSDEAVARAPSPLRLDLVRRMEGRLLAFSGGLFHCLTEAGADHAESRLGVDRASITVVPRGRRGADLAVGGSSPSRSARRELASDAQALIVNVGRHELQKGQDLLIEVAALLEERGVDARVVVVGRHGNGTSALRELIRMKNLEGFVELLGPRDDVPEIMGAATLVVVTSRWEGLGGAIVEALGVGRPIVGFGVPAVAEVVGDAGVLVQPFDVRSMASEVEDLIGDPRRREEMGLRARARFESEYDLAVVVDQIEALYERAAL